MVHVSFDPIVNYCIQIIQSHLKKFDLERFYHIAVKSY